MMYTYLFSSLTTTQFSDSLHLEVWATDKSLIQFRHHALQPRIQDLAMGGAVLREGRHVDN